MARHDVTRGWFASRVALAVLAVPLWAEAQQGKMWRIGFLAHGARPPDGAPPLALRQALQALGYVERSSRYCLTGNLKTAKALGLTIPPSLLLRADQVTG